MYKDCSLCFLKSLSFNYSRCYANEHHNRLSQQSEADIIPHSLFIKNFLSYSSAGEHVSFDPYHLICLSGKNGHGKSTKSTNLENFLAFAIIKIS